jgi:hypothetical protein
MDPPSTQESANYTYPSPLILLSTYTLYQFACYALPVTHKNVNLHHSLTQTLASTSANSHVQVHQSRPCATTRTQLRRSPQTKQVAALFNRYRRPIDVDKIDKNGHNNDSILLPFLTSYTRQPPSSTTRSHQLVQRTHCRH